MRSVCLLLLALAACDPDELELDPDGGADAAAPLCDHGDGCCVWDADACGADHCYLDPDPQPTVGEGDGVCAAAGALRVGESCDLGTFECEPGATCFRDVPGHQDICVALCDLENPSCPTGVCQFPDTAPDVWGDGSVGLCL